VKIFGSASAQCLRLSEHFFKFKLTYAYWCNQHIMLSVGALTQLGDRKGIRPVKTLNVGVLVVMI